jgi:hypothetical protein
MRTRSLGPVGIQLVAVALVLGICTLSGTVARADTFNVTLSNTSGIFAGGGGSCGGWGGGGTTVTTSNADPLNPSLTIMGSSPCTGTLSSPGTFSISGGFTLTAASGFLIDDIAFSIDCGVAGTAGATSGGFTVTNPGTAITGNCPLFADSSGHSLVGPLESIFTPVSSLNETITLFLSGPAGSSSTLNSMTGQVSLTPISSSVPEPASVLLLGAGLASLAGLFRKRQLSQ